MSERMGGGGAFGSVFGSVVVVGDVCVSCLG